MQTFTLIRIALIGTALALMPSAGSAQAIEIVGSRALGMGGAFVAVASDSSATWWNPAGLGPGPFFDMAFARALTERVTGEPAGNRARTSWFALATPPIGVSYYRFRLTDIQPASPTAEALPDRDQGEVAGPVRSLAASQWGVTLLQTLVSGVHAGTTLKYVRATPLATTVAGPSARDLLDEGEALEGGEADGGFDLDIGVLATAGALRVGVVGRNLRQPELHGGAVVLPRQYRAGVAIDPAAVGGAPLTVALDADLRRYDAAGQDRRVVAAGVEYWLGQQRVGVRAGGRVNTVGARERSLTAGVSVAPRPGLFLEGHVVRGGSEDEEGWGLAARVSF